MRRFLLHLFIPIIVLGGASLPVQAQEPIEAVWDASVHFFFDNREYKSDINWSQTLFGMRLAPEIGVRFDGFHSIMVGMNFLANFGAPTAIKADDYIAYYQYKGSKFKGYLGLIPRSKWLSDYSTAFFSDSISYFDPNTSGLLLQYRGESGYAEFGIDWNSRSSETRREKFLFFHGSRLNIRSFYIGLHASMYHHAESYRNDGVDDNILLYPHIGLALSDAVCLDLCDVQAGWMQAFQNDRDYVGRYVFPNGFQCRVRIEKWRFGINNTLYVGQNLMPYWVAPAPNLDYGSGLYWGEPFYRTDSMYDRLELYWQPHIGKRLFLRISSVHHYDGRQWSWQQKAQFIVNLGLNRLR